MVLPTYRVVIKSDDFHVEHSEVKRIVKEHKLHFSILCASFIHEVDSPVI